MNKSPIRLHPVAVALAACAFSLPALSTGSNQIELQVTPAGAFRPSDGRDMVVPAWNIDRAIASRVIAKFKQRKTPLVIDYEHQTLHKETNGQPAPAAAWIRDMTWREGQGLFATATLTARARAAIDADEYLYFSPVFTFNKTTGDVLEVQMGALTNNPGIDGMEPLTARAAATFGIHHLETTLDLLKTLIAALGLPAETTEEQLVTAAKAMVEKKATPAAETAALCSIVGIAATASQSDLIAACSALKSRADASAVVDPAKFVPLSVFEGLKGQFVALSAEVQGGKVSDLVAAGLESGKLLASQADWARSLGTTDIAALTSYLAVAQPIAALSSTQTRGKPPENTDPTKLNESELAVCTAMGITPEQFAKNKG